MDPLQNIHQRIASLSPQQRAALAQQIRQQGVQPPLPSGPSSQRLIAYVVPGDRSAALNPAVLRDALKAHLPAYMVPTAIVPLTALPRMANGKIDVRALPDPPPTVASSEPATVPQTPIAITLAQIWQDVLGLAEIGIHDNFFELGGDSILSIQIVSRAREAGLRLAPNQLFEQPTIAELAAVVNRTPAVTATQGWVTGPVPLTPIQHWFFEQSMAAPHHWHQALLVELPVDVSSSAVASAIATLWSHHDALRLRFHQDASGWHQVNADVDSPPSVVLIDLSHLSIAEQRQAVAEHGSQLHARIDLTTGGLIQVAHFTRGSEQPSWLLLSLHHLIVDAVSWQILHRDLATLLTPSDHPPQLPAKTTAFQTWAAMLSTQAAVRQSEASFWLDQVEAAVMPLPYDYPDAPPPIEATAQTVTVALDAADTHALLQSVPAVYNTQINDVLLTALAHTLWQWGKATSDSIRIEVEAHGREAIAPGIDVSRTLGWFTTTYPVRLQLGDRASFNAAENMDYSASLKAIKEQLRQVPDRGIGYGLLRYRGEDSIRQRLAAAADSEVLFNYLGQRDRTGETVLRVVQDIAVGTLRAPHNRRGYRLEINAWVAAEQLQLNWTYDTQAHHAETITRLAHTYISILKAIIAHCTAAANGGFTPSDFPDADLSQAELDDFIGQLTQEV